ncbi:MAG TPA: D-sedoheptulose 7-phosphate isomerase [Bacteroidales bacterium]|nr:D-sedoheptulose 7-phosphate isomerase [Bacteroidales bacterium]HPT03296.1 D-sedoheptulose 7-phosphate isomerase [Bacteroidales bacterium]
MKQLITDTIRQSVSVKNEILNDPVLIETIEKVAGEMVTCFRNGGKVLFCGNGGSAADAQHLAAELSGRYYYDRDPLPAEALHVNTSYLTAVANDYSFDEIYARMVKGMGRKGDMLIGFSTSGNSANVVKAFKQALEKGMITAAFTGKTGGKLQESSCYLLNVPSTDTPRIQESHIMIGHIICQLVESALFPRGK